MSPSLLESSFRDVTLPQKELADITGSGTRVSESPRGRDLMAFTSSSVEAAVTGPEALMGNSHISDILVQCS